MRTDNCWPVEVLCRGKEMSGSDFIMTGGEDIYLAGATSADQDFIAYARQDIPKLIAEIERLRAEIDTLRSR